MAIGQVKQGNTRRSFQQVQANPRAFGAGVATAISGLASSVKEFGRSQEEIEDAVFAKQQASENFDIEAKFIRHSTEQTLQQEQRVLEAPENGAGLTERTTADLRQSSTEWMDANIPEGRPDLRERYKVLFEKDISKHTLQAFVTEQDAFNSFASREIKSVVNRVGSDIFTGRTSVAEAEASTNELIDRLTHLPEGDVASIKEEAKIFFRSAEFQFEVQNKIEQDDYTATLGDQERWMLGAIAADESGGKWNVRYGGAKGPQTFTDMSQHPGVMEEITSGPHKGEFSSAAGAFQITFTNWKRLQKIPELNLTDFSPAAQTRAALYLLEERYNSVRPLGISYAEVMASGDPQKILSIKTATSPKGSNGPLFESWQNMSDEKFLKLATGGQTVDLSGMSPSIWNDKRFEDIDFNDKMALMTQARTQAATQANARNKAVMDELLGEVNAGNLGRQGIAIAADNGQITSAQAQTLNTRFDKVNKEELIRADGLKNLGNPGFVWTDDESGQEQLNSVFNIQGAASLQGSSQEREQFAANGLIPLAQQTGVIPSQAASLLRRQLNGTDEDTAAFALRTLSALENAAPTSFAKHLGEEQRLIDYYQFSGEFLTPPELRERTAFFTDPQFVAQRKQLETEANKQIKSFTVREVLDGFDRSIIPFRGSIEDFISPTASLGLMQDFSKLYKDNLVFAQGQHETAVSMTNKQISRVWGASEVGGEARFGKYMPERFPHLFPVQDDGLAWMDQQVRTDVGLKEDQPFQLIGDAQTKAEVDAGKVPSYLIAFTDDDGFTQLSEGTAIPELDEEDQITTRRTALPFRYSGNFATSSNRLSRERGIAEERLEAEKRLKKQKKTVGGRNLQRVFWFFPRVGRGE